MTRENSLLYKNVTATYHRYKGDVPYHFMQCGTLFLDKLSERVGLTFYMVKLKLVYGFSL